jgi:hypothetical protein
VLTDVELTGADITKALVALDKDGAYEGQAQLDQLLLFQLPDEDPLFYTAEVENGSTLFLKLGDHRPRRTVKGPRNRKGNFGLSFGPRKHTREMGILDCCPTIEQHGGDQRVYVTVFKQVKEYKSYTDASWPNPNYDHALEKENFRHWSELEYGDYVVSVNGVECEEPKDVNKLVDATPEGDELVLVVANVYQGGPRR